MEIIKKWLIYSSVNPDKVALTVKAGAPFILTILTTLGLKSVNLDVQDLTGLIGDFVFNVTQLVTLVIATYGLGRKIILTFKKK